MNYVPREEAVRQAITAGKYIVMRTRAEFDTWLEALRSGHYEQGACTLRSDSNRFCCLGVEQMARHGTVEFGRTPSQGYREDNNVIFIAYDDGGELADTEDCGPDTKNTAIYYNDRAMLTFAQIADKLEPMFMEWPQA